MTEPVLAGATESVLGETPDRNWLDSAAIATVRALDDAGCAFSDVDVDIDAVTVEMPVEIVFWRVSDGAGISVFVPQ